MKLSEKAGQLVQVGIAQAELNNHSLGYLISLSASDILERMYVQMQTPVQKVNTGAHIEIGDTDFDLLAIPGPPAPNAIPGRLFCYFMAQDEAAAPLKQKLEHMKANTWISIGVLQLRSGISVVISGRRWPPAIQLEAIPIVPSRLQKTLVRKDLTVACKTALLHIKELDNSFYDSYGGEKFAKAVSESAPFGKKNFKRIFGPNLRKDW
jgi:hypothetical protein